ncbi:hypothetical protein ACQJBY_059785 [Aegilops geniculata]
MEGLDVDEVFHHYRLSPTEVEAVTYYLPRLLSGETLHAVDKLIHRVDITGCEPKDLAARYAPVPQAVSSGDRFFFTTCKSKNGSKLQSVRGAGAGTWSIQKTTEISHAGVKVGEVKDLSFKKKGKSTGWVMEEYRCLLPEATVSDGVKVFCKMHLAQHAPDAARQESEAYKLQQQQPEAVTPSTHAQKRPATAAAVDPQPARPKKRMCVAVPVPAPGASSFTAAAPVFLPDESVPEADDDMVRFCCTIDELLGSQVEENLPVGATNNIEQNFYLEQEGPQKLFADAAEEIVPFEADELEFLRAILDEAAEESTNDKSSIFQDVGTYKPPPFIFHGPSEVEWQDDEGLEKEKRYNAAPDLDAPSLQGQDHLFKPRPCSFDPFEAAWKAEEALEKEKRCNAAANLHDGGHNNFFSPASVY